MNCQLKSTDPQHNKKHEVAFHPHRGYSFEVNTIPADTFWGESLKNLGLG